MRLIPILAGLLALSGCSGGLGNVHESFDFDKAAGQGLVIGSLTTDSPHGNYHIVTTMQIGAVPNPRILQLTQVEVESGCNLHFSDSSPFPGVCGRLVALKLPAGRYRIFWLQTLNSAIKMVPVDPVDAEFTVQPGRATYIGNIHMSLESPDDTSWGHYYVTGGWPAIADARARDIPLLKQAVPALNDGNIDYAVLTFPPDGAVNVGSMPLLLPPVH